MSEFGSRVEWGMMTDQRVEVAATPAVATVERLEIDGVPVFRVPGQGPTGITLMFRVGRADETVPTTGITHLVEHMALTALDPPSGQWNGMTMLDRTMLWGSGDAATLVEPMARLCRLLADLPTGEVARESGILRTESLGWSPSVGDQLLWFREGNRGHGLAALPEYIHARPDPATVAGWARERFTAGNVTAVIVGEVPSGLTFPLPRGPRRACVPVGAVPGLRLPSFTQGPMGGVAMSFIVPRRAGIRLAIGLAIERIHDRLRKQQGLIYGVDVAYDPQTATEAHVILFAKCLEANLHAATDATVAILRSFATDGPTEAEVEHAKEEFRRSRDHVVGFDEADFAAYLTLMGGEPPSLAELAAEREALTPADAVAAMRAALDSCLLVTPMYQYHPGPPFGDYPSSSVEEVGWGEVFGRRGWRNDGARLTIGSKAVVIAGPKMVPVSVRWDACAGVVAGANGERFLIGEDGYNLAIRPGEWRNGAGTTVLIDAMTPAGRFIPHIG